MQLVQPLLAKGMAHFCFLCVFESLHMISFKGFQPSYRRNKAKVSCLDVLLLKPIDKGECISDADRMKKVPCVSAVPSPCYTLVFVVVMVSDVTTFVEPNVDKKRER